MELDSNSLCSRQTLETLRACEKRWNGEKRFWISLSSAVLPNSILFSFKFWSWAKRQRADSRSSSKLSRSTQIGYCASAKSGQNRFTDCIWLYDFEENLLELLTASLFSIHHWSDFVKSSQAMPSHLALLPEYRTFGPSWHHQLLLGVRFLTDISKTRF